MQSTETTHFGSTIGFDDYIDAGFIYREAARDRAEELKQEENRGGEDAVYMEHEDLPF
jgi:hypothetical protein